MGGVLLRPHVWNIWICSVRRRVLYNESPIPTQRLDEYLSLVMGRHPALGPGDIWYEVERVA